MKKLILASALTIMSTAAYAADAIIAEPAPIAVPDTFSWTGGYIGVNAGYIGGKPGTEFTDTMEGEVYDRDTIKQNMSGFIGGVQAGYNWQFDRAVFGLETDIQGTSMKKYSTEATTWLALANNDFDMEKKITWLGTTRARIGFLPTERLLTYVTAGVAYGGVKTNLYEYSGTDSSKSKTKVGYAVGAGAEYALDTNWTIKGEYLYANLGNTKHVAYSFQPEFVEYAKSKFHAHIVRVGINYKF